MTILDNIVYLHNYPWSFFHGVMRGANAFSLMKREVFKMLCKKCGTKNDEDMAFCQNCGESIKTTSSKMSATPTGNTIKGFANVIFILEIICGIIVVIGGIVLAALGETAIPLVIGIVLGAIIFALSYVSKAFVYGYGIIVSYCERRGEEWIAQNATNN